MDELWLAGAQLQRVRAAWAEAAAGELLTGKWHRTGDRWQWPNSLHVDIDVSLEKEPRIGVMRARNKRCGRADFNKVAGVHDRDTVTHGADDADIVRYQDQR